MRRISFRAPPGSLFLRIRSTDPAGTGEYLRNIRVFRADQAQALEKGQLFNPEMLAYLAPFGSLRFMDWMEGNQQGLCSGGPKHGQDCYADVKGKECPAGRCVMAGVWSERPRMDQPSLLARSQFLDPRRPELGVRVGGYPVEMLVALANAVGADPHFNLPAAYTDEYVREFARYVEQHTAGQGFDIVFDTVGGTVLDASFDAVRRYTGHVVSALGWGTHRLAPLSFRGATYSGVFTLLPLLTGEYREHHGRIMAEATQMAEAVRLKPRVDPTRFTLDTVEAAHRLVAEGSARGKVIVDVRP